jgi:hypothetical protein
MYWFCGVNDNSQNHKDMYIAALRSALKYTTLIPMLIYDGDDSKFMENVNQLGSKVIKHSSVLNDKPVFQSKPADWKSIGTGAFLRIDIPLICKYLNIPDKYVLYTDTDVIFMQDVVNELHKFSPKYFAVCPEFEKNDWSCINTGVMLINLENMYTTYNSFVNYMESKNYDFPAFDQGALAEYYFLHIDQLPIYFNHKPYWGIDKYAKIVHYHGPKHNHIAQYLDGYRESPFENLFDKVNDLCWKYYYYLYKYHLGE